MRTRTKKLILKTFVIIAIVGMLVGSFGGSLLSLL